MLWFGGFHGFGRAPRLPVDARPVWLAIGDCWVVGDWAAHEVRAVRTGFRRVVVIGPCGALVDQVARLATHGVPDDVAWRWPGSYVVVQVTTEDTTLWTDVGGAWPLYTLAADTGVYWASSSRALAALTNHRLDEHRLAALMLDPVAPLLVGTRSMFAGISLVPAGNRACLSAAGRVEVLRVWHPQPRAVDHVVRLREELTAAVALRVDPAAVPTADLSGGYDSTTLTLLAAEHLRPEPVIGVTVHPEQVTDGGDLTYARHVATHHPGVDHRLMPLSADQVPFSALDTVPVTDEPAPSTIAHARFSAQLRWMMTELGSDCHLTGDGGDGLLTTPLVMLADLVAHRRRWRALYEAIAWARLRRIAVWPLLVDAIRSAHAHPADVLCAWARSLCADAPHRTSWAAASGLGWAPALTAPIWATRQEGYAEPWDRQ